MAEMRSRKARGTGDEARGGRERGRKNAVDRGGSVVPTARGPCRGGVGPTALLLGSPLQLKAQPLLPSTCHTHHWGWLL